MIAELPEPVRVRKFMQGNLVIISSPSGGGKGTLIKELLASLSDIGYSVSLTTRPARPGEIDGEHYHFVTRDEFELRAKSGEFLEYAEVHGNYYGTTRTYIDSIRETGKDVILEIDVQGAGWVLKRAPDAVSIFIMPPSFDVLRDRLTSRATEGAEDLATRLQNSVKEVGQFFQFEYVVINDRAVDAAERLRAIIVGARQKRIRQETAIRGILDSFEESKAFRTGD